jgi:hypothetical protein
MKKHLTAFAFLVLCCKDSQVEEATRMQIAAIGLPCSNQNDCLKGMLCATRTIRLIDGGQSVQRECHFPCGGLSDPRCPGDLWCGVISHTDIRMGSFSGVCLVERLESLKDKH